MVAVETTGAASLASAISAGKPVTLESIDTIANTLGAKRVSDQAFEYARSMRIESHIVSDSDALDACYRFLDDHRVLVEPACGATLAAVYSPATSLLTCKNILVIACGGMGVSRQQLTQWTNLLGK